MQLSIMRGRGVKWSFLAGLGLAGLTFGSVGCVNIGGKEPLVRVGDGAPPPVDTTQVQVRDMEDARAQLAQAHARINYLERQNANLRHDKEELKADMKKVKAERDSYKKSYERAIGKD